MSSAVFTAKRSLSLGFQARMKRVARLLTQQEFAELAGVSPREVALLENGELSSPATVARLLKQLGIQ